MTIIIVNFCNLLLEIGNINIIHSYFQFLEVICVFFSTPIPESLCTKTPTVIKFFVCKVLAIFVLWISWHFQSLPFTLGPLKQFWDSSHSIFTGRIGESLSQESILEMRFDSFLWDRTLCCLWWSILRFSAETEIFASLCYDDLWRGFHKSSKASSDWDESCLSLWFVLTRNANPERFKEERQKILSAEESFLAKGCKSVPREKARDWRPNRAIIAFPFDCACAETFPLIRSPMFWWMFGGLLKWGKNFSFPKF